MGCLRNLEKADTILVIHIHKDHCKDVTVKRLRRADTLIIVPKRCVRELGKDLKVRAVEACNTEQGSSARTIHRKGYGVGYLVAVRGKTIYHPGDKGFIAEMKDLVNVEVASLPIGETFTMDAQEAAGAAIGIRPKVVIPMYHLQADSQGFKDKLEAQSGARVVPLGVGEVYHLT